MATRRSLFRFRLPWSQDEPASRPSTRPNASTTPSQATRTGAGSKPAAPTTSTDETPTSNKPPDPTTNTSPGISTSPIPAGTKNNQERKTSTSPPRPIESSGLTNATATTGETQIPLQPSTMSSTSTNSPARPTSQTTTRKIGQRPPFRPAGVAPSPKNRASRNESQSSSPPQATNKSRISSPLASPSDASTKSRLSQSPATTSASSPARKAPQVQESSDSPSVVKAQVATLPTSPPKSLQEMSGSSSKSTQPDAVFEANVSFTDKTMQPWALTRTVQGPSEKSHSSSITGESNSLKESASNIQEEERGKDYGAGEKSRQVQPKQANMVKQEEATKDHSLVNPVSNGRPTRVRNKTISTGSSQITAVSSELHIPLHKDNISKVLNRVAVGGGKEETGKTPVNVITLAGDNRGASMQLGSDSSTKGGRIHIHRGYKINPDESAGEGRPSKDAKDQTVAAYVNCNVQGINNSISSNTSIAERNPGVHMSIPRVPSEPVHSTGLLELHKPEFSVRTIKRRCLRGLFLESSDSDPDKPPRHGCRVACNDKKKITT